MSGLTKRTHRRFLPTWAVVAIASLLVASAGAVISWGQQEPESQATATPQLTEIVSSNGLTLSDEDGDYPDWFEIFNPYLSPISLNSFAVVTGEGEFWQLPSRLLEPEEFLVIFASGKDRNPITGELHTIFRLPQSGGFLGIYDLGANEIVGGATYPAIPRDASYGLSQDQWCFFAFPTPESANSEECFNSAQLGQVSFSHPGGFYDSDITLALSAEYPNQDIIYTLDGSYPDLEENPASTLIYSEPLVLSDRTPEPAIWAAVDGTIPNEFVPSAIPQPEPEGDVVKATTVRARLANGGERAETFLIGQQNQNFALPVLSLMVDGECLFDPVSGIYVAGETFSRALEAGRFDPLDPGPRPLPANYLNRGSEFQCPTPQPLRNSAWVQTCSPDGQCFVSEPSFLRIHGGWTRTNPQKSLRLYSSRDIDGNRSFQSLANLNQDFDGYRNLILRMAGGNSWTHWDDFVQSLVSDFSFDTQSTEPVVVFINGEYWGLYNLRHRYDRHFLAERHGVNPEEVHMLGNLFTVEEGPEDAHLHFRAILTYLRDNHPSDSGVVDFVNERIDLEQFYDFAALNLFFSNGDWPHNNVQIWREAPPDVEPSLDSPGSPWKFLIYDLDSASLRGNILEGRFAVPEDRRDQGGYPYLFHRLMESDTEREKFLNRISDLMNSHFHPSVTIPQHSAFVTRIEAEMDRQIMRWGRPASMASWEEFVAERNDRLMARPNEQRQILVDWFGLEGFSDISIGLPDDGGTVEVNSLRLEDGTPGVRSDGVWSGHYFSGIPVELTVKPDNGYELTHWTVEYEDGQREQRLGDSIAVDVSEVVSVSPVLSPVD